MLQEIERKYAIKYLPQDIQIEKIIKIEQNFIYHDGITLIRLRKITPIYGSHQETQYIYTVKTKGDIEYDNNYGIAQKYEIESNITETQYTKLISKKTNKTIKKTRIDIPIRDKLKAEVDIYDEYLDGLLTLEIEFPNKQEAEKFEKPDWFGEELGYKELSNRKLSEMTRKELENKVTKEFMENNQKIIKEFKKREEFQNKICY